VGGGLSVVTDIVVGVFIVVCVGISELEVSLAIREVMWPSMDLAAEVL
jgi:hypothetical protein